jgi:DNA-binding beta-propeller fold protein YncE
MNARRLILATLCTMAGGLVLSGAPALALEGHVFSTSFSGSGSNALSDPQGVAIDQSTGEVYVADKANARVEIFSASGTFISQFGTAGGGNGQLDGPTQVAVDNSTGMPGDVYVLDGGNERVEVFNARGEYQAQITEADLQATDPEKSVGSLEGIAVDSSGNLWIVDKDGNRYEFPSGGALPGRFIFSNNFSVLPGLAINSSGDLYSINGLEVLESEPNGNELGSLHSEEDDPCDCATAVAVDPATDGVYVDQGTSVAHFLASNVSGTANDSFGSVGPSALIDGSGVAVDGSTDAVYVADVARHSVDIFDATTLAEVTTEAASGVAPIDATLHGAVNPAGFPVSACQFEYGTEAGVYPDRAPCSPAPPYTGNVAVAVEAALSSLKVDTTYHYRLAATDANGTNYGRDETLTTLPAVEGLSTDPAEDVTSSGAKLIGLLSPDGTDAHYYFEYGPTNSYGSISPALPGMDAGTGGAECEPPGGPKCSTVSAETTLSGLTANTSYHYRLIAVNSFGATDGQDVTLTTPGPPTIEGESAEVDSTEKAGQTNVTLQAQIDPDGRETTYSFEYGETKSYGSSVPIPPGDIGSGEGSVSVPATELTGLKIGTTYHYRVSATNEYGTIPGPDQTFTTVTATLIEESVSNVAATSATLDAQINPFGSDTYYYFQYGATSCAASPSPCASAPSPPGTDIGAGETLQDESVHLQGLLPGVTYHYRVVAVNALNETTEGPDQTFTTQRAGATFALPDGRAWELVSLPDMQGAGLEPLDDEQGADIQASEDGGAITYVATAPIVANPAGSRSVEATQVISNRNAPGEWESRDIATPHTEGAGSLEIGHTAEYKLFSADLSVGLVEPAGETPLPPLPPGSEKTVYMREGNGEYRALVTSANVPAGTKFGNLATGGGVHFAGASPDLSHIVLGSSYALTSNIVNNEAQNSLFEWAGGQLQLVSVLPSGKPATEEGISAALGSHNSYNVRDAISKDGSRVVWLGGKRLYLRDMAKGETVQIDAPQPPLKEEGNDESLFQTANSEDSRVFFTSTERLTADSTASESKEDLYGFEVISGKDEPLTGRLTDLTADKNVGEPAEVLGVIGASEDGSYVYFVANGVLGDGAEHGARGGSCGSNGEPTKQSCNLYLEHYDEATKAWAPPTFIAALSGADAPSWGGGRGNTNLKQMTSRVSPNGRYLAFMSERSLTGYDNRDANSGVPDEEVFLYDDSTGHLACASCDPTGARPVGMFERNEYPGPLVDHAFNWSERWLAANIPGWTSTDLTHALYQSRYLSDSGRLFFNSSDALVPADVNGVENVYEYEPDGVGSCQTPGYGGSAGDVFSEGAGGCVGLISSGTSPDESAFMDASETGGDVFFLTDSRLVSQDYDTTINLYDAHECTTESPCASSPALVPPPCSTGEACKPAPTPQPAIFGASGSETFSGAGNLTPAPTTTVKSKAKPLTRAQKLTKALRACKKKPKSKRKSCEAQARKKYGAAHKAKKTNRRAK